MKFITQNLLRSECPSSSVVIDWSGGVDERNGTDENLAKMIEWIKTYPRKADIHVYLGKCKRHRAGRKLQGALQAMGCKVTTRQLQTLS